ncbi:CDT1-like protein a, chloroplastic isoform X1 [Camellia sinensis]|uniref:CDT1-like protein a, chloroplastic isoform X1 n=1 Tax=Camellia sinensis TaxID=4442 RepID=UPI0010359223|nr:CDT1-like protein a, chloroplastic isoform X1 [Camellia sinensis]
MESSDSLPFDSFKSKKILHSSAPKSSPPDQLTKACSDSSTCSSKTPEKPPNPPSRVRNRRTAASVEEMRDVASERPIPDQDRPYQYEKSGSDDVNLPEKYEILGKFFNSLDCSIRLLRLRGSMSTFTNICPKVERLTDRRFSHGHLAQLKFILPEVIEIKKVLVHDERTCCMKPDLHVTMNVDAIKNEGMMKLASGNSHMRKVFQGRLLDFFKAHHEGEVPEGTLPEPFNQSKLDLHTSTIKASSSSLIGEALTDALEEPQPAAASHLSQSFQKCFSKEVFRIEAVHSNPEQSLVSVQPSVPPVSELQVDHSSYDERISASAAQFISKFSLKPTTHQNCSLRASQASVPQHHSPATAMKDINFVKNEVCSSVRTPTVQGTPAKHFLTPVKLMSATPALQPPKRCYMSPDDDSTSSPNKSVNRPLRIRSLKFDTPVENAKMDDEVNITGGVSVDIDSDIFEILPENLLQSIGEKERKALEQQDPAFSQVMRRQQMIGSLPKLFDLICYLFQSIKSSVITKEELMHKIVASHLDIVDRREVEEQLELLQELVPGWIYERSVSSGDLLICINKISSPELLRARLVEAK